MKVRTYRELCTFKTFQERFNYLRINGTVGVQTFGLDRIINQNFYKSPEWKTVRDGVIIRDNGCDLGVPGNDIFDRIIIHHMNPIVEEDIINFDLDKLLNPEVLIVTSLSTHNGLHYGIDKVYTNEPIVRTKFDTCPWKKNNNGGIKMKKTNFKVEKELVGEKQRSIEYRHAIVKVSYFGLLNIRKLPNKTADIVCKVSNNSHLTIDPTFDNDTFVKVITDDRVKGYCMKEFIRYR